MYLKVNKEQLTKIMAEKGYTCYSLAKAAGIGLKSIWRFKKGISRKTDHLRAKVIATALNCDLSEIFT